MLRFIFLFTCIFDISNLSSQSLPPDRTCQWSKAGTLIHEPADIINMQSFGAIGDGIFDNSPIIQQAILSLSNKSGVLFFPTGNYFFSKSISLKDSIIIQGNGSDSTRFIFNLKGTGDCIISNGNYDNKKYFLKDSFYRHSKIILTDSLTQVKVGDFIKLIESDSDRITSSWAYGNVGQIVRVNKVIQHQIYLDDSLRMSFTLKNKPYFYILKPQSGIGLECFSLLRMDSTAEQSKNISFNYTVGSWIHGISSRYTNFAHISLNNSSNIEIKGNYFTRSYGYGGGGRGYGVELEMTSGNCLIENNIFEHLRHSVLLQACANGNVIAYNYSFDPFWQETFLPSNSAGDLVLHGNWTFQNLFEGNICQNIVIDNSHGLNGPYNTFYRNRAELYGIFMNSGSGNEQHFIGNEITGSNGLYQLNGSNHIQLANNRNGTLLPANTNAISDTSLYLKTNPFCWQQLNDIPIIGYPTKINELSNNAYIRYKQNHLTLCRHNCPWENKILNIIGPKENCPNQLATYTLSHYLPCTEINWKVTGGKIIKGQGTSQIDVQWNEGTETKVDIEIKN